MKKGEIYRINVAGHEVGAGKRPDKIKGIFTHGLNGLGVLPEQRPRGRGWGAGVEGPGRSQSRHDTIKREKKSCRLRGNSPELSNEGNL